MTALFEGDECGRCEEKQASCRYCARMTPVLLRVAPGERDEVTPEAPEDVVRAAVALFRRGAGRAARTASR